jgi:hypothetical protein
MIGGHNGTARLLLVASLAAPALTGCRASASVAIEVDDPTRAHCPVCEAEGDLACLCVRVGPDTPSSTYLGRTYYFCSTQCKQDFDRKPAKYVPR